MKKITIILTFFLLLIGMQLDVFAAKNNIEEINKKINKKINIEDAQGLKTNQSTESPDNSTKPPDSSEEDYYDDDDGNDDSTSRDNEEEDEDIQCQKDIKKVMSEKFREYTELKANLTMQKLLYGLISLIEKKSQQEIANPIDPVLEPLLQNLLQKQSGLNQLNPQVLNKIQTLLKLSDTEKHIIANFTSNMPGHEGHTNLLQSMLTHVKSVIDNNIDGNNQLIQKLRLIAGNLSQKFNTEKFDAIRGDSFNLFDYLVSETIKELREQGKKNCADNFESDPTGYCDMVPGFNTIKSAGSNLNEAVKAAQTELLPKKEDRKVKLYDFSLPPLDQIIHQDPGKNPNSFINQTTTDNPNRPGNTQSSERSETDEDKEKESKDSKKRRNQQRPPFGQHPSVQQQGPDFSWLMMFMLMQSFNRPYYTPFMPYFLPFAMMTTLPAA